MLKIPSSMWRVSSDSLGIGFAADGDKAPPVSMVFNSFGLQFDLSGIPDGSFKLGHAEGRIKELCEQWQAILASEERTIKSKELEMLHGRLVWFNAFVFGRTLKAAVTVVPRVQANDFEFGHLERSSSQCTWSASSRVRTSRACCCQQSVGKDVDHIY